MARDTPRFRATSFPVIPELSNCFADSALETSILGLRPPAASGTCSAQSCISSFLDELALHLRKGRNHMKKNLLAAVEVSMLPVMLLNCTPFVWNPSTSSTWPLTVRPSRSDFQITKVSPCLKYLMAYDRPSFILAVSVILSVNSCLQPASLRASS